MANAKPKISEHLQQVALFTWANRSLKRYPELRWLHAIPNGGRRHLSVAKKLKAEGVKAGVSDVCLPVARKGYHGFYAELKSGTNKPTETQKEFIDFVKSQGYHVAVYWDWVDVKEALEWYLESERVAA